MAKGRAKITTALAVAFAGMCMWCGKTGIRNKRHFAKHILEEERKHPAYAVSWAKATLGKK